MYPHLSVHHMLIDLFFPSVHIYMVYVCSSASIRKQEIPKVNLLLI